MMQNINYKKLIIYISNKSHYFIIYQQSNLFLQAFIMESTENITPKIKKISSQTTDDIAIKYYMCLDVARNKLIMCAPSDIMYINPKYTHESDSLYSILNKWD